MMGRGKRLAVSVINRYFMSAISEDAKIEANFVCSEKHRTFFREHIGNGRQRADLMLIKRAELYGFVGGVRAVRVL